MNKAIICASALMLTLSACEMKDELWGSNNGETTEMGRLELNVKASEPTSLTRAEVSTSDFAVSIKGKGTTAAYSYNYATVSAMPASILMPQGSYDIEAHSPGELQREMSHPYYKGKKSTAIGPTTVATTVNCTMANSRFNVVLSSDFATMYSEWDITIDDGSGQVLSYDENSDYSAPLYWYFSNETPSITVNIRAVKDGNIISESNTYTKSNATEGYIDIENPNFTGGDAITINFSPAQDESGYMDGITITTTVTFQNYDEDVTIEVKDEGAPDVPVVDPADPSDPNDPPTPGDDITVDFKYGQNFTVDYQQEDGYPDVEVDFAFAKGLQNLFVKVAGSADFEFACGLMGLTDGDGLDLTGESAQELRNLFTLPKVGDTTYVFSLNETLWDLLTCTPGYPGVQTFTLKAVDKDGNTKSASLTININE